MCCVEELRRSEALILRRCTRENSINKISIDNPGHLDILGRVAFARHLLDLTERIEAESNGAVLGLEGSWGSGKTRVLSLFESLVEEVPEERRPVLIRFNPWMVSGTSGLVEALLLQMAADLPPDGFGAMHRFWNRLTGKRSDGSELSVGLVQYARILGSVKNFGPAANMLFPGSGYVLEMIGNASELSEKALTRLKCKLSLADARRRIETVLNKLGRRIIVLIDDLDRLPPQELASMIQAVKAVADFPNVVYVLAYDPPIAAQAVKVALRVKDGHAFLEKIVQIPLRLPELPIRKFHAFAISRLKSSVETGDLSGHDQGDLEKVWPLVASLVVSPRDVERLRTRLLVVAPIMKKQVNIADIVLLETLSLKALKIIEWIQVNVTAVISPGLSQYDAELLSRGQLGDPMADAELAVRSSQEVKEKRAMKWETLIPPDPRMNLPIRNAMAFLFERCERVRNSVPKRSDFRRVQDYRYWYRWRCYHDHHERWAVTEIDQIFREPKRILEMGLDVDPDVFREFCQQACDVGLASLSTADSMALVAVYKNVEEVFGFDLVNSWDVGYGPLDAFLLALRLDQPINRVSAIGLLIEQASVWFSGRVVINAWREIFKPNVDKIIPEEQRLVSSGVMLAPILEKWFAVADAQISNEQWSTPSTQLMPYTLLSWMRIMGRDVKLIQRIARHFIGSDPVKLAEFFAGFENKPEYEAFPPRLAWDILPNAQHVRDLAENLPYFSQTHTQLMTDIRQEAERVGLISTLVELLRNLAMKGSGSSMALKPAITAKCIASVLDG